MDEYRLEDIARDHPIHAGIFIPFVIARLGRPIEAAEAVLDVQLRDVADEGTRRRELRIAWLVLSVPTAAMGVQTRTATEWAACGVACAVMSVYAGMRVREVALDGDRFDYWVDDGSYQYGLEVTGTLGRDLESLHRLKVSQLRQNPYGVDGYVVAVSFGTRQVIVSFNRFEEDAQ